jgi:hypothetical protein
VPTSLDVVSATVIPDSYNFEATASGADFGISAAVQYQVLDQYGAPYSNDNATPVEFVSSIGQPPLFGNVGPSAYPGTSQTLNSNGQYTDAPVSALYSAPLMAGMSQTIYINANGSYYNVGTVNWLFSDTGPGTGSIVSSNGVNLRH